MQVRPCTAPRNIKQRPQAALHVTTQETATPLTLMISPTMRFTPTRTSSCMNEPDLRQRERGRRWLGRVRAPADVEECSGRGRIHRGSCGVGNARHKSSELGWHTYIFAATTSGPETARQ
jgi:hypothetical protein